MKEGGGSEGDAKSAEEKLKRLRKRNAELVALARQLDDKTKTLKMENEQLVTSHSILLHFQSNTHSPSLVYIQ